MMLEQAVVPDRLQYKGNSHSFVKSKTKRSAKSRALVARRRRRGRQNRHRNGRNGRKD